jgi:uncharacterized protein YbaR (Trm112 family)
VPDLITVEANDDNALVRCIGCNATFLIANGIPIMLSEKELTREERALVNHLRKIDEHENDEDLYGLS